MDFNLIQFGKELYYIRKELNLSIDEASFLAGISEKTIYRIEYGKNKISSTTLDKLSCAYKRDLFDIYNKHLKDPEKILNNIIINSEEKLYIEDAPSIQSNINKLRELPLNTFTSYKESYIKSYIKLLESTYIDIKNQDRQKAISILSKFMESQIYGFKIYNYENFNYSPIEIRILMNLSSMAYNFYQCQNLFKLLSYLLRILHRDNIIYPKLMLNLSTIHHNKKQYKKSLDLVEDAIEHCIYSNNKNILSKMFFRKFTSELNLGIDNYKNSLNKAILFAEINNHEYLKNIFINSAKKFYNISLLETIN